MEKITPVIVGIMLATLFISSCSSDNSQKTSEESSNTKQTLVFTDSLAFISAQGDTVAAISIAVADEPQERARGLMHVTELGSNEGMLFIFKKEQPLKFWMANTPLSLDIMFVNSQKKIIRIHHSVPPFTKENFASGQPALYAVETNGGFTIGHDIREGMRIQFNLAK